MTRGVMREMLARRSPQLQRRRGVTIVFVAMLIVVLIGIAGITIDFSRMYLYLAQLQTAADAAAYSGAVSLARGHFAAAQNDAVTVGNGNVVDGVATSVTAANVYPGTWDYTRKQFVASTWAAAKADDVVATHTALYTLGRVFNRTNQALRKTAIAAVGYVSGSSCLKPWAVSYDKLLQQLPGAPAQPYDLTTADVTYLTGQGANKPVALITGNKNTVASGDIAQVVTETGNTNYNQAVSQNGCSSVPVGPGTVLDADPGAGKGQTANPLKTFCKNNGGITATKTGYTCDSKPVVQLAIYGSTVVLNGQGNGSTLGYVVKYVGAFAITGFQSSGTEQVLGYFTTLTVQGGSFSGTPSPLVGGVGLVQ